MIIELNILVIELEKQIVKEEGEYEKLERERQATLAAPQNNQEFKRYLTEVT